MIRYRRLGYVALNVSDTKRSADFYRDVVGLQQVESSVPDAVFLRCSDKHFDIALFQGEPGLKRVGFELESASEIAPLCEALRGAKCAYESIPEPDCRAMAMAEGIRTQEPVTGSTLDFYIPNSTRSNAPAFEPTQADILRLGHVVIGSREYERTLDFYTRVLNFKASDTIDGMITFLRCFPSPYHHSIGIGNASKVRNGLHHVALMVADVDDIGRSYWRLQKAGVTIAQGPGRHPPSGSVFLYFLDPDGLTLEYTLGMEEFPEVDPREPRSLPPVPQSVDNWASPKHPGMGAVGAIEQSPLHTTEGFLT